MEWVNLISHNNSPSFFSYAEFIFPSGHTTMGWRRLALLNPLRDKELLVKLIEIQSVNSSVKKFKFIYQKQNREYSFLSFGT